MIRQRGQFPKYMWQKGALYSTKKSRKDISMGRSPELRKRGKGNLLNSHNDHGLHLGNTRTLSEVNRFTANSFANLHANRLV